MASHSIFTVKCKENTGIPARAQLASSVLTWVRIHCLGNGATRQGQVLTTSVNIVMAIPYRTTWSRQSLTEAPSSGNSKLCQVDNSDQPSVSLPHCLNFCLAQIDSPSTYMPRPDLPFYWDIPFMFCPSSFWMLPFNVSRQGFAQHLLFRSPRCSMLVPSLAIAFWAPFCSTNLFVCLSPGPHHSNYYSFTVSLDILVVPTCDLQKCWATLSGSFPLIVIFGVIVFISTKRLNGILRGVVLNP